MIGVDRLDYSKGLPARFDAFRLLLTRFPEHRAKVTYMQIAPLSRDDVAQYRMLRRELESAAGRINGQFAEFDWVPVRYLNKSFPRRMLAGFYRASRIGLVTPFRDGMNLVAKEYVASQDPADPGVLVLSRFAGAARELKGALIVNPFDVDQVAEALDAGLHMASDERRSRWHGMMDALRANTITDWRESFLEALQVLPEHGPTPLMQETAGRHAQRGRRRQQRRRNTAGAAPRAPATTASRAGTPQPLRHRPRPQSGQLRAAVAALLPAARGRDLPASAPRSSTARSGATGRRRICAAGGWPRRWHGAASGAATRWR